jgi:hypothetical protein
MSYLFGQDDDLAARPAPNERPDLPTSFGDTFMAQWSRNEIFSQDYIGEHDRFNALGDYLNTIKQRGGPDLAGELDYGGFGGGTGVMNDAQTLLQQTNNKLAAFKQKNPAFDLQPITADELQQNAVAKRRKADADFAQVMSRERGPGATLGAIAGGVVTGTADPINLALLPIAPEESLGIVANAIRWGVIGGAGAAASTALQAPYREAVEPGYISSGQPLLDIARATGETALGGLIFRGVADAWSRVQTGAWPESVKQAGNLVAGQANTIASNIYAGPEGEVAHAQALSKASDDILRSYPVDVSKYITPELEAGAVPPIEGARTTAQAAASAAAMARAAVPTGPAPELPFVRTEAEAAAERAKDAVTANVQQIARGAAAPYAMPAEEAARVADKLLAASPEEAQDLLRDLHMSPRQVAEAPARIEMPAEPQPVPVTPVTKATPELEDAMRADLDRELAAPPRQGSRDELVQMLQRGAPTEDLIKHPEVERAVEQYQARIPTGTAEDFKNPEWRAARVYDFDGERVQGWDQAVSRLTEQAKAFAGGPVKNDAHAIILLGGPASGKSTIAERLAKEYGAAIVDSDEAKKVIPEYQGGLGTGAVHEESTVLAGDVLKRLVPGSTNIMLPKVGNNPEIIRGIMTELKSAGYTVDLVNAHVPVDIAQRRNIERFVRTGRLVEPKYIAAVGEKPRETAHILRGEAHEVAEVDNLQNTVEGTGQLADTLRAGRDVGPGAVGGIEGAPRAAEPSAGLPTEPGAARAAPENLIPNIDEQPVSIERALREVDGYKAAAEQLAACGAPAQAEAA